MSRNGPDVKIRGNPSHIAEKYVQLARDAQSSGDPVAAENYYQHAEHYNRLIAAAQEQFRQQNPQFNNRPEADMRSDMRDDSFEDGDEEGVGNNGNVGNVGNQQPVQNANTGEAPYGRHEPQPFIPREAQPFPNQPPQQQPQPQAATESTPATWIVCRHSSPAGSRRPRAASKRTPPRTATTARRIASRCIAAGAAIADRARASRPVSATTPRRRTKARLLVAITL